MIQNNFIYKTKNLVLKKSNDKDIIVNYNCYCSKSFYAIDRLLYILPCCHIIHENCFNEYILKYQYKKLFNPKNTNNNSNDKFENQFNNYLRCPFCQNNITTVLTEYKINSKKVSSIQN